MLVKSDVLIKNLGDTIEKCTKQKTDNFIKVTSVVGIFIIIVKLIDSNNIKKEFKHEEEMAKLELEKLKIELEGSEQKGE